jgi:hypothetical protein
MTQPPTLERTRQPTRWRHVINAAVLVAILAVAAIVQSTTPTDEQRDAAIAVRGPIGAALTGRNIAATIRSVKLARTVSAANGWKGETTGVWVVVEASAAAVVDDTNGPSLNAVLRIGDTTYTASSRPRTAGTIADTPLSVGIPWNGPLMFEIPKSVARSSAARSASIEIAPKFDTRADSIVIVTVDLTSRDIRSSVSTPAPTWGRS